MAQSITPFLMFEGAAEAAMRFYVSLFKDAQIDRLERYGSGETGVEGTVKKAAFTLRGRSFICSDSSVKHDFTFTPSISLLVELDSESEIQELFQRLSDGGKVFMPLDHYGFSKKFGWVSDRFGVSWQLNLAA
ncbi:VOC family protein [Dyella flava]|uniref:VOC family protein n=1 Tax=Dyella flava TaxID=1920170 RepID=A0ABS2K782_9GAMM|nr:VOC family protein [Dyella flava]MBM7127072.1 VOC family protein [Dyella flava]GLQ50167.1 VOC family protein [Dyella flava]